MLTHAMTTSEVTRTKSNIAETNTELNTDLSTTIVEQRGLKHKWRNIVFNELVFSTTQIWASFNMHIILTLDPVF